MTDRPLAVDRDHVEVAHEALIWHWPRLRGWLVAEQAAHVLAAASETPEPTRQRHERNGAVRDRRLHRPRRGRVAPPRLAPLRTTGVPDSDPTEGAPEGQ